MAAWLFLKLHFNRSNGGAIGPGRVAIMEAISRFGSLTSAAQELGLTYRHVWNVVQTINSEFDELVVVKRGRHGGGAVLTPRGVELVNYFRAMEQKFYNVFSDDLRRMESLLGETPDVPYPVPQDMRVFPPSPPEPLAAPETTARKAPSKRALPGGEKAKAKGTGKPRVGS
ncbi:LysR family transcriptional regulator [Xanthobacter sp. 126]|uniref:winged helix-turn-helix domain-containing protein n=1 Tax=Xanthobacter sp. 126 TaxID=1131814 RepID=UPI00045E5ECA|nr:LysR family transcriptional regulator [Xanthobacter sp. 126]